MSETVIYNKDIPYGKITVREKIVEQGIHMVTDMELIAAIIGTGTKRQPLQDLSYKVLEVLDQSRGKPKITDIQKIQGMGIAQSCKVMAAYELGRRLFGQNLKQITNPADIWDAIKHLADRTKEQFICCTLNGAQALIHIHIVTVGIINKTIVHPREIFAEAMKDRACSIIVAHNHPSGRLEASHEDIEITRRISEAGEILGIPLLDHIIFSETGFISLKEKGWVITS